jgi:hypothetical protein
MQIVVTCADAHRFSTIVKRNGVELRVPRGVCQVDARVREPLTRSYPIMGTIAGGPIAAVSAEESCRARYTRCHFDAY